jgi:hypothetical protein
MSGYAKSKGFVAKGVAQFRASTNSTVSTETTLNMFTAVLYNDSVSIVKNSDTQVTLKAGKKYRITCNAKVAAFTAPTTAYAIIRLKISGTTKTSGQFICGQNTSYTDFHSGTIQYIHFSGSDETLTITGECADGGGCQFNPDSVATIIIEEVEAYAALTPATAGMEIAGAVEATTPADADLFGIVVSNVLKKLTWANIKATLLATAMTWTGKQTFDGGAAIKGVGTAIAAGYVGETLSGTSAGFTPSSGVNAATGTCITLTPGTWILLTTLTIGVTTALTLTRCTFNARNNADGVQGVTHNVIPLAISNFNADIAAPPWITRVAANKAITVDYTLTWSSGSVTASGSTATIVAIRIA